MRVTGFALLAALFACPAVAQHPGSSGQQTREIKALSAGEIADLIAGRGMGMAKAGELNHYPGPAHVLDLRNKLALTPEQVAQAQASFDRMASEAQPLGSEIVRRERALDEAFKLGEATFESVAQQTEEIGTLQGQLRAIHLNAHLKMRALLTAQQVTSYDKLRGYDGPHPSAHTTHR